MFALVYAKQRLNGVIGFDKDARIELQKTLNRNGIYTSYNSCYIQQWDTSSKNIYLRGRFESYQYFHEIRDVLLEEFTPKQTRIEKNAELYKIIDNKESVCISIRRGDFLDDNRKNFNVCNLEYFNQCH